MYTLRVLEPAEQAASVLARLGGVDDVELDAESQEIQFRCQGGAQAASEVVAAVIAAGLHLARFGEVPGNLEATFVQLTREGQAA
jgi:hypothetical protein